MENKGFDEHATNFLEKQLNERTQRVVLNGIESNWINLKRGVPQGTFWDLYYLTITSTI